VRPEPCRCACFHKKGCVQQAFDSCKSPNVLINFAPSYAYVDHFAGFKPGISSSKS
jgi:hypothetical protein